MTTNIDRAAEVIEGYYPACHKCGGGDQWAIPEVGDCAECATKCHTIAQALDHDGLLPPELPAPDYGNEGFLRLWHVGDRTVAESGGAVQINSKGTGKITFDGISDVQIAQLVQILRTSEGARGV